MKKAIAALAVVAMVMGSLAALPGATSLSLSYSFYGSFAGGWGFTPTTEHAPGPTLVISQYTHLTLSLAQTDGLAHSWYVDLNGNSLWDQASEPGSPDITSSTPFTWSFDANFQGTYSYRCRYHPSMVGSITTKIFTLSDFPQPLVNPRGNLDVTAVIASSTTPHLGSLAGANAIDVVGFVTVGFLLGRSSTGGNMSSKLDTEAATVDVSGKIVVTESGNLLAAGGKGANGITKVFNSTMPIRVETADNPNPALRGICTTNPDGTFTGTCYRRTVVGTVVTDHAYITMRFDSTAGRYVGIVAGQSGFSTRALSFLIAQRPSILSGTGIVVRFVDSDNNFVFETYQVVDGTGGPTTIMPSPAPVPVVASPERTVIIAASSLHNGLAAAHTIDVVGGVSLGMRLGRDLHRPITAKLDQEAVTGDVTTGFTVLEKGNLITLGGKGANAVTRVFNSSFPITHETVDNPDPAKRGFCSALTNTCFRRSMTTSSTTDYGLNGIFFDAANRRFVEEYVGLSGFATRMTTQVVADGTMKWAGGAAVIKLVDNGNDNVYESITMQQVDYPRTIDQKFYDPFTTPYGEWWYNTLFSYGGRYKKYGDVLVHNSAPYSNMYPSALNFTDRLLYAPIKFNATAKNVSGYSIDIPDWFPICADLHAYDPTFSCPAEASKPGGSLTFDVNFQYVTNTRRLQLCSLGVACVPLSVMDGFIGEYRGNMTMDYATAAKVIGMPLTTTDPPGWFNQTDARGYSNKFKLEDNWSRWIGDVNTGKLNSEWAIYNAFEWTYTVYGLQFQLSNATLPGGQKGVRLYTDRVTWGDEVLLSRSFQYGAGCYPSGHCRDGSTRSPMGWWKNGVGWFEDLHWKGSLGKYLNFNLDTVIQYYLKAWALPGADGFYNTTATPSTDDIAVWNFEPSGIDYVNASNQFPYSELTEWNGLKYLHATPGIVKLYGKNFPYDYSPTEFNLGYGEKMTVAWPTTAIWKWNPLTSKYLDPSGGLCPQSGTTNLYCGMKATIATSTLYSVDPTNPGAYDPVTNTLVFTGPIDWGAPDLPPYGYPTPNYS